MDDITSLMPHAPSVSVKVCNHPYLFEGAEPGPPGLTLAPTPRCCVGLTRVKPDLRVRVRVNPAPPPRINPNRLG